MQAGYRQVSFLPLSELKCLLRVTQRAASRGTKLLGMNRYRHKSSLTVLFR